MGEDEPRRCERCGVPEPDHPDSAKAGGMPIIEDDGDRLCTVCRDVLAREVQDIGTPMDRPEEAREPGQSTLGAHYE